MSFEDQMRLMRERHAKFQEDMKEMMPGRSKTGNESKRCSLLPKPTTDAVANAGMNKPYSRSILLKNPRTISVCSPTSSRNESCP
jgi:hypothetical protein